jgi:tRNA(Ile)-lysidine synthase
MGSTANKLKEGVRYWYESHGIPLNSPQVIAFSGGADSVALLYTLKELGRMRLSSTEHLTVAYYNHKLRSSKELEKEIAFIQDITTLWGVELVIGSALEGELAAQSMTEKRSLEDVARDARYAFLEALLSQRGANYLVLAHHGNDQAETMITRYFQGSGLAGLSGIQPVQGNRIRPLLPYRKKELISCLKEEGISWSEDSTNCDKAILRNDLRQSLIPEIESTFPGFESSLIFLSEKLSRYDDCLSKLGEELSWKTGNKCYFIRADDFFKEPAAVREYSLYYIIDKLRKGLKLSGGKGRRFPYRFIRPLLEEITPSNLRLDGHGLMIEVKKNRLTISLL